MVLFGAGFRTGGFCSGGVMYVQGLSSIHDIQVNDLCQRQGHQTHTHTHTHTHRLTDGYESPRMPIENRQPKNADFKPLQRSSQTSFT